MDDISKGLRLLIRMLHHRIREAVLDRTFDPTVIEVIRNPGYLSGGAGVSTVMRTQTGEKISLITNLSEEQKLYYAAQSNPEDVYRKYLQWLIAGTYDPNINIFTRQTQIYLSKLPVTKAYFHYILMQEYGRKYNVIIRKGVALLYFTDDPLVCPHFFKKSETGWQMDMLAEVKNTRNRVGGVYTWDYRGGGDIYTKTFSDKLVNIKNYIRIADGDNRELPIRGYN
jgi:hypothetical protein